MTTLPQPRPSLLHRGLASMALAAMLSACGGGGGSSMTPPAGNADPVAAFNAPDSIAAGSAARFDAAASSDADGDALTYSWEFSSGSGAKRGGGKQIAQAFATPGTYTVRLTVADGRGGVASASRTLDRHSGSRVGRQRRHDDRRSRPVRRAAGRCHGRERRQRRPASPPPPTAGRRSPRRAASPASSG